MSSVRNNIIHSTSDIDVYVSQDYCFIPSYYDVKSAFKLELNHLVSVNMFAFKNYFFVYLDEYFKKYFRNDDEYILNNEALLPELIKEKLDEKQIELQNLVSNSSWFGMTYKEDLIGLKENIEKLILKGEYPRKLWE